MDNQVQISNEEVTLRPEEIVDRSIDTVRKMIVDGREKRMIMKREVEERVKNLRDAFETDKQDIRQSVRRLEEQISKYHEAYEMTLKKEEAMVNEVLEAWATSDAAMNRLITSQEAMLKSLTDTN